MPAAALICVNLCKSVCICGFCVLRAGMQRVDGPGWQVGRPVYYLLDRSAALAKPAACQ